MSQVAPEKEAWKEGSSSSGDAGANKARIRRRIGSYGDNKIMPQLPGLYPAKENQSSMKNESGWEAQHGLKTRDGCEA